MISKRPLIAIIDDDDIQHYLLTRIIDGHNLAESILTFLDGEKALQFLADNSSTNENIPDIIFLDNNMPIMDGWQFLEEYPSLECKIKKKVHIFMASSSVNPEDIERARNINQISGYIEKPITLDKLKGVIDDLGFF